MHDRLEGTSDLLLHHAEVCAEACFLADRHSRGNSMVMRDFSKRGERRRQGCTLSDVFVELCNLHPSLQGTRVVTYVLLAGRIFYDNNNGGLFRSTLYVFWLEREKNTEAKKVAKTCLELAKTWQHLEDQFNTDSITILLCLMKITWFWLVPTSKMFCNNLGIIFHLAFLFWLLLNTWVILDWTNTNIPKWHYLIKMLLFQKLSRLLFFHFLLRILNKTESPDWFGVICTENLAFFPVGAELIKKPINSTL